MSESQPHRAAPGRLPPTRQLLEALRPFDVLAAAEEHAGPRGLWLVLFWAASMGALAVLVGAYWYRREWHVPAPAFVVPLLYGLLGASVLALGVILGGKAPALLRALRHPLRMLADRIDADSEVENALLLALGRMPPLALRARQRSVELQLTLWEGLARTVLVLIALGPLALALVTGVMELPRKGSSLVPLLSAYLAASVFAAALALLVRLHCTGPLRRLAHVLREAAEIGTQLGRKG